ncbi:MAG TPA: prolyl oligopeptidase family serine peptidase [Kofleriaceae bacterium]|nr:prolyl oligopeptidase family serine peptidase [Kofleriaceae bacterium]
MRAPAVSFGLVMVVGAGVVTLARADTPSAFDQAHAPAGPSVDPHADPFAYPHGIPRAAPQAYSGLGAESVSADVIAKFAPPPLDPKVSRELQAMLDVRGTGGGVLSNSGAQMFFTWRVTGTAQVWRQDGPKAWPIQLTGGEDNTTVVDVAPDDSFVVVSRDIGGEENPGLYVLAPTGGELRVIQHAPKVQTKLAFISDDSQSVFFTANDRAPDAYAVYRFDVKTGAKELVFDTPGLWSIADHRGDHWLMQKHTGSLTSEIYDYDVVAKSLTPVLGVGETETYDVAFGAKAGQLLALTDKLGEYRRLYAVDVAKDGKAGTLVPIVAELPHDLESFAIDRARARIYYVVNEDGFMRTHVIDARTFKPIALPKLPVADSIVPGAVVPSGRFAQFALEGATTVPTSLVLDWQTRRLVEWRSPETPEVDVRTFMKAELESYPARDGVKIPMFVRRSAACAKAATPCPVIVEFHGGPESQITARFSSVAQLFVDRGFVLVQPNVRGSSGYGKTWLHADDGPKRLDVITDIEDCAKFIRGAWAKGGIAPKIGVTGGSYGGYSVLMAMTLFAGAYDAGVEQVGIANLVTFLANTAPYRRILRISEYGDPVKDKLALEKLSPINYIDRVKAPLLIFQGVNDPRVPVGEALQIHDALEARKIANRLILFADEGHGASKRGNVVLTLGHTLAFFEQQLK